MTLEKVKAFILELAKAHIEYYIDEFRASFKGAFSREPTFNEYRAFQEIAAELEGKGKFICDSCNRNIRPTVERYHCTGCSDFDLCEDCFTKFDREKSLHKTHAFQVIPQSEFQRSIVIIPGFPKYTCDICEGAIPADSKRYHCMSCTDYDVCDYCFDNRYHREHTHTSAHDMLYYPHSQEESGEGTVLIKGGKYFCELCRKKIIGTAVRYKCCVCPGLHMCEDCYGANTHPKTHSVNRFQQSDVNQSTLIDGTVPPTPAAAAEIDITVNTHIGRTLNLRVGVQDTGFVLSSRVQEATGMPRQRLRMMFQGRAIGRENTLEEYGIANGATLHVYIPIGPGGGGQFYRAGEYPEE